MSDSSVSLIIVNYNRKHLLKTCLDSVFNLDYPKDRLEVIVVDNGSVDGSQEFIKTNYSQVKLILNPINNYCISNNLGIKEAKGKYIGLLNNDIKLDKNWLKKLLEIMQKDDRIGAATGKIMLYNRKINSTGHKRLLNFYWQDRGYGEKDKGLFKKNEEVDGLSHCACIYRKSCLEDIGLLDESFNMYLEDVDMSIRAKNKGWRLYYVADAICYHHLHGTADRRKIKYYYERNRLFLIAKHYPLQLEEAIFDGGFFSTVKRLDKDFLFSILEQIKQKFDYNFLDINLINLKQKIEEFHRRNKLYISFIRLLYNFLYFIRT